MNLNELLEDRPVSLFIQPILLQNATYLKISVCVKLTNATFQLATLQMFKFMFLIVQFILEF